MRAALVALLALLALALLAAPALAAGDQTVTFDGLSSGTAVTDQYADLGGPGQGVVFGPLPGSNHSGQGPPVVTSAPGQAHSGSNVADISCLTCNEGIGNTFADVTGSFHLTRSKVSVYVGLLGSPQPSSCAPNSTQTTCAVVELLAFDASGNQIAASPQLTVTQGAGVSTLLSVSTKTSAIAGFEILTPRPDTDGGKHVAVDDLTFNTPKTAPPAFAVRIQGLTNVSVSACSAVVHVVVSRQASFPGPVSLSVSGLPGGITASFAPNPVTFPNNELQQTIDLTLTIPRSGSTILSRLATVHATAPPLPEQTTTFRIGGTCPLLFDPEVISMQITQGTQLPHLPQRDPTNPGAPITYASIGQEAMPGSLEALAHLEAFRLTYVRVYADLRYGPSNGIQVPAVLHGFTVDSSGHRTELPGSPILPSYSPRLLYPDLLASGVNLQTNWAGTYSFTLPSSWEHGRIELEAELLPPQSSDSRPVAINAGARAASLPGQPLYGPCTSSGCVIDNRFTISQIPFQYQRPVTIRPLAMIVTNPYDNTLPDPSTVFNWARNVTPVSLQIEPYAATIDVSDVLSVANYTTQDQYNQGESKMFDHVGHYICNHGEPSGGWDVGISHLGNGFGVTGDTRCWQEAWLDDHLGAMVDERRPLTSVSHELFHLLGRPHASPACGANHGSLPNVPSNETWPPDQWGYIQSVGEAPAPPGSGFPYQLIGGKPVTISSLRCRTTPYTASNCGGTDPAQWFDFMSYCADPTFGDPTFKNAWVSVHNWNAVLDSHPGPASDAYPTESAAARAGPLTPSLAVSGYVNATGGVSILSVEPSSAPVEPASDSSYHLVGTDQAGHVRTDVLLLPSFIHSDGHPTIQVFHGAIPAAGVTSLSVVHNGVTLATRRKSAHPPDVRIGRLPSFHGRSAILHWSAHDRDGDHLGVEVGYSGDGGRNWQTIWMGPNRGRALVPARYLFRSRRARLRITVNDGFQTATALSREFRSPGAPPAVTILTPSRTVRQPNAAPLVLSGQAFDDRDRVITGRSLRWILGRRLLGTGQQLTVAGLPAGRHKLKLVARDRYGRLGTASVIVVLKATRPLFLRLSGLRRVSHRARSVRLTLASSLIAKLTIRVHGVHAQRFDVSRALRRLRVKIPIGRKQLTLKLSLTAGGLTRTLQILLARR